MNHKWIKMGWFLVVFTCDMGKRSKIPIQLCHYQVLSCFFCYQSVTFFPKWFMKIRSIATVHEQCGVSYLFIFFVQRTCLSFYVVIRYLLLCSSYETWTYECHAHVTNKSKTNTKIWAYGCEWHTDTHTHMLTHAYTGQEKKTIPKNKNNQWQQS